MAEMALVTMFCPLATTGKEELVVQIAGGPSLTADCNVNVEALVGQVKMMLVPETAMLSCGGAQRVILNMVPALPAPPSIVVP